MTENEKLKIQIDILINGNISTMDVIDEVANMSNEVANMPLDKCTTSELLQRFRAIQEIYNLTRNNYLDINITYENNKGKINE